MSRSRPRRNRRSQPTAPFDPQAEVETMEILTRLFAPRPGEDPPLDEAESQAARRERRAAEWGKFLQRRENELSRG